MKNFMNFFWGHPWRSLFALAVILVGTYLLLPVLFPRNSAPQYQTAQVTKGTIVSSVSVSGVVSTASTYSVTTSLGGVVKNVYVKDGDTVAAGDKLLEINPQDSDQQKQEQAYASYLTALNSVTTAKQAKQTLQATILADQSKLLTAQLAQAPTSSWDPTDKNKQKIDNDVRAAELSLGTDTDKLNSADSQIAQAQASLAASSLALSQTQPVVSAPVSGVVSGLTVTTGSVLTSAVVATTTTTAAASSSNASTKLAYIKVPGNPAITLNISEIDISKIKQNQKATVTLDAFSGKTFTGKVTSIDQVGSVTSGVTNYPVTVTLDDKVEGILPNMNTNVSIITDTKADVLTVPTSAVQTASGATTVRELRNKQLVNIPVVVGLSDDSNYEVISGLNEGDSVVTAVTTTGATTSVGTSPFGGIRIGGGIGGGAGGGNRTFVGR